MTKGNSIHQSMTPLEWGMLVGLSLLWGGSFFFNGIAVKELPPFTIILCRVGLGAIILYLVMKARDEAMPTSFKVWTAFLGMGMLQNILPFSLIVWGQNHIASSLASILNATTPLFAVIVAHWFTSDEKLTPGKLLGVLLGFGGIVILIGDDVLGTLGNHVWGQLAILGASVCYAFSGIFGRRFAAMKVTPFATATGQVTASTFVMLPIALFVDQPWTMELPSLSVLGALFGLATLSTALAYLLFFRILSTAGATNILLVTFLIPISAILLGVMFLGEVLEANQALGMTIIGLGLAAIDGRLVKKFKDARTRREKVSRT